MWKLKSCPKCSGDLFVDSDMNGWYEQCLQCGYIRDLGSILEIKHQPDENKLREKSRELALAGHHKKAAAN